MDAKKNIQEHYTQINAQIHSFPIVEYAKLIGYTPVKKGKYYTLKEHDSVIIDTDKNCFWRNSNGAKGSLIDFSAEFEGKDTKTAFMDLAERLSLIPLSDYPVPPPPKQKQQKETKLLLPPKDNNIKNIYAYLVGSRKINKDIVSLFIKNKNLYQDKMKNCVFVSYHDKKTNYICIRGTNTNSRFVKECEANDYNRCFFIKNTNAQTLIVAESTIDLMSVMSILKNKGRDLNCYNYLSTGGSTKIHSLLTHVEENPDISKVILAFDNDNAGKLACENARELLKDKNVQIIDFLPREKDWNLELQHQSEDDTIKKFDDYFKGKGVSCTNKSNDIEY